ncbi:MAG: flavodoxin family protein [Oscillospiraceae bacterium]|nr:flavodoxin family protein [Oscillospiraceae bacterium]
MKNILVVVGSSRKNGNTDQLADAFIRGAEAAGHNVNKVFLGAKKIGGCLGCNACRYGKPCIQKDDWAETVPLLESADLIVFASPLYFWTVSARLKAFIERFYSIAQEDPDPPLGRYEWYPQKDCALLLTAADDLFWTFEQAVSYYRFTLVRYIGFRDRGILTAGGCGSTNGRPCIEKTGHLDRAFAFGQGIYAAKKSDLVPELEVEPW